MPYNVDNILTRLSSLPAGTGEVEAFRSQSGKRYWIESFNNGLFGVWRDKNKRSGVGGIEVEALFKYYLDQ